ncbi:DNA alkylation repair protein [Acutalibacter sp. 1XD8-36]|uniref:DNA alkylation repair protein n=1 Tax=Acutalibacter sp. 1XD8-36 TaxID=2320852 RepID=UPI0014122C51|nr:DNA alkylation repair protein [Acutalibacter sp. 1XD8-36]NBJ90240.1 DNA alkylation repair protein [Acutalibacter sp. 1XD8-36]
MNEIVRLAAEELEKLSRAVPEGKHIVTGDIRRLSGKLYRQAGVKDIDSLLNLCGELLELRDWAAGVVAFNWAYRVKDQYTADVYLVFYRWLKEYVRGWGDCDDFCTHAFGEMLRQHKELFPDILEWTAEGNFWMRRASAVVLIPSVMRNDYAGLEPYAIVDRLLTDPHDLVQKGYGWMLKCLSQFDSAGVERYLTEHCHDMPRVAFRYALEKFDRDTRARLMAL